MGSVVLTTQNRLNCLGDFFTKGRFLMRSCYLYVIIVLLFHAIFVNTYAHDEPQELVILNWADYLSHELVKDFEQQFKVKVREVNFESDEERNQQLVATLAKGFDIVVISRALLEHYKDLNWIIPLDETLLPNLRHIEARWLHRMDGKLYAMPYTWGTAGIAYRSDLVKQPIESWMDLLRPQAEWKGKITMLEEPQEVTGQALKALGYSVNESSQTALDAAEELLQAQRPFVNAYRLPLLNEENALAKGDVWLSVTYNGDALLLKNEINTNIDFVVPKEGTQLWVDNFVVMRKSQNPKLAMQFLNFMQEPENAVKTAKSFYYAVPNIEAQKLLPKAHLDNPLIYPPASVLEKSEFIGTAQPRTLKRYNQIFYNLTN